MGHHLLFSQAVAMELYQQQSSQEVDPCLYTMLALHTSPYLLGYNVILETSSVGASFHVDHTSKHLTQNCFFFSCLGHGSKEGVPLYFLEFQEYYL